MYIYFVYSSYGKFKKTLTIKLLVFRIYFQINFYLVTSDMKTKQTTKLN